MDRCICGYLKDKNLLKSSSSGGLAYSLAKNFVMNGGIVYGVAWEDDYRGAKHI